MAFLAMDVRTRIFDLTKEYFFTQVTACAHSQTGGLVANSKITVKPPFPMPNMEYQFVQLAGNKYFYTLYLRSVYQQIGFIESNVPHS